MQTQASILDTGSIYNDNNYAHNPNKDIYLNYKKNYKKNNKSEEFFSGNKLIKINISDTYNKNNKANIYKEAKSSFYSKFPNHMDYFDTNMNKNISTEGYIRSTKKTFLDESILNTRANKNYK